ncbi:MAG TPA: oligoribonuclease [Ectothiorhodospiraceae bacterium]|nr:oligoribonuclease [Ectothiorhodospiraceae bacterium]
MTAEGERLIWIDLEMTGLNPQQDRIIEIATIVTDAELNEIAVGPVLAIHQDESLLAQMDDWNQSHHSSSGLLERVRQSKLTMVDAEQATLEFLKEHIKEGDSPMCGNSICQDRRFMALWMPALEAFFHYRNLDVSTLKELARRWYPEALANLHKRGVHLALEDIRDSIDELRYYRKTILR